MHLCKQGEEAYLLAIFLRMRRIILPDLVFGSPVRCTDVIRTQECCCNGLSKSPGLSSSTCSANSLLPRKSSLGVPLQTVQPMSNEDELTWSPVDNIRSGNGANDLPHCGHELLLQLSGRRILCALHYAITVVRDTSVQTLTVLKRHVPPFLSRPMCCCTPHALHHIAVQLQCGHQATRRAQAGTPCSPS